MHGQRERLHLAGFEEVTLVHGRRRGHGTGKAGEGQGHHASSQLPWLMCRATGCGYRSTPVAHVPCPRVRPPGAAGVGGPLGTFLRTRWNTDSGLPRPGWRTRAGGPGLADPGWGPRLAGPGDRRRGRAYGPPRLLRMPSMPLDISIMLGKVSSESQ